LVRSQTLYPAELPAHLLVPKYTITNARGCQVLFSKKYAAKQKPETRAQKRRPPRRAALRFGKEKQTH
ncbi:MAG: hypothetical protein IJL00_00750, partial [Clostridia bacterium]|nr:hypothetical protein [Clostridia bacterium]